MAVSGPTGINGRDDASGVHGDAPRRAAAKRDAAMARLCTAHPASRLEADASYLPLAGYARWILESALGENVEL